MNALRRSNRLQRLAATTLALLAAGAAADSHVAAAGPLEPREALADFQLPSGYRIELVAAEPEVVDPIAIAFDDVGRLWVVEMRDYPTLPKNGQPSSRIRILQDREGDGRYETGSTFADNLLFPTGFQPWRGGVIVTLAGEIAYFPDDNRDNRADRCETWYQGFATGNEQLRANHPQLAADGWVYVAGGLRGGQIRNLRLPDSPAININGRDFAFHPATGECRAVSGNGQFGLTFDDFGRRFTCSNRNPLMQVMIEQRYLEANPAFMLPQVVHDVAAAGADSRLYPRTRALTTSLQHAGQFTAACGVEIARGDALPPEARGDAFICEPTANLVHREALSPAGAAFTSHPVDDGVEFLSATDEWFRPVNLCTGPDGALYVVDMYRAVIEHPEWMPQQWRDRPDMRAGADRGRIYRIVAEGARRPAAEQRNCSRSPADLVAMLNHANSWHRETATRLLLERGDSAPVALLVELAKDRTNDVGRYHALAALGMLECLSDEVLLNALDDSSPGLRELAVTLAESRLAESPSLRAKVLSLAEDGDPRVRYQVALSSAMLPAREGAPALVKIMLRDADDLWTRRAVALASRDQAHAVLHQFLSRSASLASDTLRIEQVRELIDAVTAIKDPARIAGVVAKVESLQAEEAQQLFKAVAASLEQQRVSLNEAMAKLAADHPASHRYVHHLLDAAASVVVDKNAASSDRTAAAELLRFDARDQAAEPLLEAAEDATVPAVQIAAIDTLRRRGDPAIAERLVASFQSQLPSVRGAVVELLMATPETSLVLLHAVAEERIAFGDVGAARAQLLSQHTSAKVRELADEVLGSHSRDRAAVVSEYQAALTLDGDAARGKQVFVAACSSCHRIADQGTAIGPDIGDSAMKASEQLLTDILDPNQAIDANYVSYTALTVDGLAHQGIIRSESASGVVLFTAEGKTVTVLREDLESLAGGESLMPEGLERQISVQAMADLLAYLKTWRQAEASGVEPILSGAE